MSRFLRLAPRVNAIAPVSCLPRTQKAFMSSAKSSLDADKGSVGSKFKSDGEIGSKVQKNVSPDSEFSKDGKIGSKFEKGGTVGGTAENIAKTSQGEAPSAFDKDG